MVKGTSERSFRGKSTTNARVSAVTQAAKDAGLLGKKDGRISGRVSHALIERAKQLTGIQADTDLIEFALANIVLEDDFAKIFRKSRGKVASDL